MKLPNLILLLFSLLFSQFEETGKEEANTDKAYELKSAVVVPLSYPKEEVSEVIEPEYEIYNVSAYTSGIESTGKTKSHPEYGITASGTKVKEGRTLSCPKSLAFGTEIYIPYFDRSFTCEDRGGAIKEGKLDVYMENLDDALEFGRRNLEVQIIRMESRDES